MCHSENRCGDKQNKNRWGSLTVTITKKTDAVTNTKTVGACETVLSLGKHK